MTRRVPAPSLIPSHAQAAINLVEQERRRARLLSWHSANDPSWRNYSFCMLARDWQASAIPLATVECDGPSLSFSSTTHIGSKSIANRKGRPGQAIGRAHVSRTRPRERLVAFDSFVGVFPGGLRPSASAMIWL